MRQAAGGYCASGSGWNCPSTEFTFAVRLMPVHEQVLGRRSTAAPYQRGALSEIDDAKQKQLGDI
ncbi:hypothetical protein [Paenibacillus ehimensis]|uniref:Uncharacterized protein n=1 Tax=Paenibacillus ehimensis TaxID=79264 RepID=A0ABT8V9D8_9BACL|nr:hypothetical protein [Paenibacillus ehimensis]MDO3677015.1 hypothetical protein [Paenibacillus ehimensis]MEC0214061.1 hypothetical protein [Paenibacillus ehimensis]